MTGSGPRRPERKDPASSREARIATVKPSPGRTVGTYPGFEVYITVIPQLMRSSMIVDASMGAEGPRISIGLLDSVTAKPLGGLLGSVSVRGATSPD